MARKKETAAAPADSTAIATIEPPQSQFEYVELARIHASTTNPRKHFDEVKLAELVESVRKHGVLQPILVRPAGRAQAQQEEDSWYVSYPRGSTGQRNITGTGFHGEGAERACRGEVERLNAADGYELVAGERRWRSAKAAGLERIPATIRELTDQEVLEIQVIENLQRADLHPLEEAQGYHQLVTRARFDVATIAARVGRSPKYVYDRLKLCELTEEAQKLFLEDRFTAGHAILLARLSPTAQKKALDTEGAVFCHERLLFDLPDDGSKDAEYDQVKPTSVRELSQWIDDHVRFDTKVVDSMLFPETAATVSEARDAALPVVLITHDYALPPEKKEDGAKTYTAKAWKRADGEEWRDPDTGRKQTSKTCDYYSIGVIAIGEGRGESFRVCIAKEKCDTHWGKEKREKAKRAAGGVDGSKAKDAYAKQRERQEQQWKREEEDRQRWKKCVPAIAKAIAERVIDPSAAISGLLRQTLLEATKPHGCPNAILDLVPVTKTAESVIQRAAFMLLYSEMSNSYSGPREFPKVAKKLGIDVKKILNEVAPKEKPQKAPKAKRGVKADKASDEPQACRDCGCTESTPCVDADNGEPCAWQGPDLCTACADVTHESPKRGRRKASA